MGFFRKMKKQKLAAIAGVAMLAFGGVKQLKEYREHQRLKAKVYQNNPIIRYAKKKEKEESQKKTYQQAQVTQAAVEPTVYRSGEHYRQPKKSQNMRTAASLEPKKQADGQSKGRNTAAEEYDSESSHALIASPDGPKHYSDDNRQYSAGAVQ